MLEGRWKGSMQSHLDKFSYPGANELDILSGCDYGLLVIMIIVIYSFDTILAALNRLFHFNHSGFSSLLAMSYCPIDIKFLYPSLSVRCRLRILDMFQGCCRISQSVGFC